MNHVTVRARLSVFRRFTSAGLVFLLAASVVGPCLPETAEAAEAHCPPPARPDCERPVMDCCDAPQQQLPAVPEQAPAASPDNARSAAGLDTASGEVRVGLLWPVARLSAAPAHGYRFTDLSTLNSVFLI
jgi:hypothetical protein